MGKKEKRKKPSRKAPNAVGKGPAPFSKKDKETEARVQEAIDLVMETLEAMAEERGAEDKIWGSMVKQTLKRRQPSFNESYFGFRSFNRLLDEAANRGLIELEPDEKSGGYIIRGFHHED